MKNYKNELVNYRLHRAKKTFEDAKILAEKFRWNSAINRLYYSSYYAVTALFELVLPISAKALDISEKERATLPRGQGQQLHIPLMDINWFCHIRNQQISPTFSPHFCYIG